MGSPCTQMNRERDNRLAMSMEAAINIYYSEAQSPVNSEALVECALSAVHQAAAENAGSAQWIYLRVGVEPQAPPSLVVREIATAIEQSGAITPIGLWWWLNKLDSLGFAIRLRMQLPSPWTVSTKEQLLACLEQKGIKATYLRYEPELLLFGGTHGIDIAHHIFARDSMFLASWSRAADAGSWPIISPGLSFALVLHLLRSSGLDLFEQWDLFNRLADKRETPRQEDATVEACTRIVKRVVATSPEALIALYEGPLRSLLREYVSDIEEAGRALSRAYFGGKLECGLRGFLVPVILFHWNRIRLPFLVQGELARAAVTLFSRLSRKGRGAGHVASATL